MARCDQGYLCRVCGEEVEHIHESELYLRYVIGEIDPEKLHLLPECHLTCSPTVAQFILDSRFEKPPEVLGPFAAANLDPTFVAAREKLISRGYSRLWEIQKEGKGRGTVQSYILPEFENKWK
jgi:hypothetical protein